MQRKQGNVSPGHDFTCLNFALSDFPSVTRTRYTLCGLTCGPSSVPGGTALTMRAPGGSGASSTMRPVGAGTLCAFTCRQGLQYSRLILHKD